jgi:hypothetical protein
VVREAGRGVIGMADESPFSRQTDDQLVRNTFSAGGGTSVFGVEMMRRLKDSMDAGNASAAKLGDRIWWLNFWLLIFTIAIFGLTAVLVLSELRLWPFSHLPGK